MSTSLLTGSPDEALLEQVSACSEGLDLPQLTVEALHRVATTRGHDVAVALLYDRLWNSPQHGAFIREIECGAVHRAQNQDRVVAVVPGAFHREKPETGADGERLAEIVERLGYRVECIPLPSLATSSSNAELIRAWVERCTNAQIVLISLSKGGLDVLKALSQIDRHSAASRIVAWINLSGILQGTPLVSWLRTRRLRWLATRGISWWRGYDFRAIEELDRSGWQSPTLPHDAQPDLKIAHVVGFPRLRDLTSTLARRVVRRTAAFGPNDGGGIVLADVAAWPGLIYPAWSADHYLRPEWPIETLINRLLHWV